MDNLLDMVFPEPQSVNDMNSQGVPTRTLSITGSPFTYTSPNRQTLHIIGGTINVATYKRGSASLQIGLLSTGSFLELYTGDAVTIAYVSPPTITLIPR